VSDSDEKFISVYEKMCLDVIDSKPNMMIPWYIMASYAYYVQDDPLLSDGSFDRLVHRLLESYNEIEHQHKSFVTTDALEAGTYLGEYPTRTEDVIKQLRREYGR